MLIFSDLVFLSNQQKTNQHYKMYIYNVTANIEESIHEEWLIWIKEHIPQVLATGKFEKATLTKVLVEEDMGGTTYSIQYKSYSREALDAYYREDADKLRQEGLKRFADKMLAFRTELQIIDEYTVKFK
jgi:predicted transposase YbfD/YdcC